VEQQDQGGRRLHRRHPEYNHSLPGVLKNAIDSVFVSFGFRNKPIAAVAYSGGIGAGIRAIEHLAHVAIEAEAVPLRNSVVIPFVATAFDEDGQPLNPVTSVSLDVMLDDLAWWSPRRSKRRAPLVSSSQGPSGLKPRWLRPKWPATSKLSA
jgi:NAD(P)H-dependent FMN reductase